MRLSHAWLASALLVGGYAAFALPEPDPQASPPPASQGPANQYSHDRFGTLPMDIRREFAAFLVSFDSKDNGVCLGVPDWVAYELRKAPAAIEEADERPGRWATDAGLHQQKIAPNDASYAGSGYSRGHMCMKSHAGRISAAADKETHTVLNACPQLQGVNNGVWKAIENRTAEWADAFGAVWIITGPVFFANKDRSWIGDAGEVPVAVADAFFKIVVRPDADSWKVLAFLVPMHGDEHHHRSAADVRPYLTSIDAVEALTGLNFLANLPEAQETELERAIFTTLWGS